MAKIPPFPVFWANFHHFPLILVKFPDFFQYVKNSPTFL